MCEGQWTGVEVRKNAVSAGLGMDATDGCSDVVSAHWEVDVRLTDTGPGAVRGSLKSRLFAGSQAVARAASRGEAKHSARGGPQVCLQLVHLKMNEEGKYIIGSPLKNTCGGIKGSECRDGEHL